MFEPWRKRPRDGQDGKDADPELVRQLVREAFADMPKPRNGRDADPALVVEEVRRAVSLIPLPKDGARGPRGPEGPEGPIGPMPKHEWKETSLRFEMEPGVWGKWVDLKGNRGEHGVGGVIQTTGNSWFPGGW